jgi:hypothetical protein
MICTWLPYCVGRVEEPRWLGNFDIAAAVLRGQEHEPYGAGFWEAPEQFGYSDAVVHNALESMCWACMIDPGGDPDIASAQERFRKAIPEWIERLLAAQEADGLLHTYITAVAPQHRTDFGMHYFYCQAYFIEAAVAHYRMTGKSDPVLYDAARRCADNIVKAVSEAEGPVIVPHAGIEYALFLLSAIVKEEEGAAAGKQYEELSKLLCDNRGSNPEHAYCQNHLPVIEQSDAVGHAVRAVYLYAGMTDVARHSGDVDYGAAVQRLWSSAVDRRMYLTGGVGACDETESFDQDYLLPNAFKPCYCESCASCAMIFWAQRMNLAGRDAKYIDILELCLYNTVLGSVGAEGETHYYCNPLDDHVPRKPWIGSCCQGNIARTFASLGNYIYAREQDTLYVNLFIGGTCVVNDIAGTTVEVVQETDYPWDGAVSITLNPGEAKEFTVRIRIPKREFSECYTASPELPAHVGLAVNGEGWEGEVENGYAAITRNWQPGDRVDLVLPMDVQRVTSHPKVEANRGRVAFMRGPLVYAFEDCDNAGAAESLAIPADAEFRPVFDPNVLNGVTTLQGTAARAIPFFARLNRGDGRVVVWVRERGASGS